MAERINLPGNGGIGETRFPIVYNIRCNSGLWYLTVTGILIADGYSVELQYPGDISTEQIWFGKPLEFPIIDPTGIVICLKNKQGQRVSCETVNFGGILCECLENYSIKFQCRQGQLWMDFSSSSKCGLKYNLYLQDQKVLPKGGTNANYLATKGTLCNPIDRSFTIPNSYQGSQIKILIEITEDGEVLGTSFPKTICVSYLGKTWQVPVCAQEPDTTNGDF